MTDNVPQTDEQVNATEGEQQQQVMDHKRFETLYLQNLDIIKDIASIMAEIEAMKIERKEARSFAYTSSLLTVMLIATAFLGITAIIAFS